MPYKPSYVANSFLYRARHVSCEDVTPLKIQKLVYFLHGWHLAVRNQPAVGERFEAWPYGPVIPSLYHEFKANGSSPIKDYATDIDPQTGKTAALMVALTDKEYYSVFDTVWEKYGRLSGLTLSTMTHADGTPWSTARAQHEDYIEDKNIRDFFLRQVNK